jgi:hypothetical protein
MPTTPVHFTLADLEQWVEKGLITPEQLTNIRSHIEAAGSVAEQVQAGPERRKGLNFVSLAYYFGGFMILLAYTIFMGLQWESLEFTGQIAISLFTIIVLWAIGYFLQRNGFRIAGGLLIFAGTGIVPLFVFTVQRALGIWPDDPRYAYMDFYQIIARTWVLLELISLGVAVIVIWRVRFTLISLLIAFWTWFLSMDITRWMSQSDYWTWSDREQIVSTMIGVGMLGLGVWLQRRTKQDYSFWFYLFGHIIVLSHLSALTLNREGFLGIVYLAVYISFVVASVWLQRRVFLVFGAIGCYSYLSYLAFRVFEGALGFVFALGVIGLLIVLTAVGYQKYLRSWLENQLARYRVSSVKS